MNVFWSRTIETSLARLVATGASMVFLIVTARGLGPEGRGQVVSVLGWVALYSNFASLSLGLVAQEVVARIGRQALLELVPTIALMGYTTSLIAVLVAALQYLVVPQAFGSVPVAALVLGFLAVPFLVWEVNGGMLLAASDDIKGLNRSIVTGRLTGLSLSALSVGIIGSGPIAVAGVVLGQTIGFAVASVTIRNRLRQSNLGLKKFLYATARKLAVGSAQLHLSTIASFLVLQSGVLLLNALSGSTDAAHYQIAVLLIGVILVLPLAASLNFTAKVAELGPDTYWPVQRRQLGQILMLVLLGGGIAYLVAPSLIVVIAGKDFLPSAMAFRQLLPVVLPLALAQLMSSQWYARGAFMLNSVVSVSAALLTVGIGYVLISQRGLQGAIITDLTVQFGVVLLVQLCFLLWCDRQSRTYLSRQNSPENRSTSGPAQGRHDR